MDDVLKAVEEIAGEGVTELINAGKDESSASWPTLNRYRFICRVSYSHSVAFSINLNICRRAERYGKKLTS